MSDENNTTLQVARGAIASLMHVTIAGTRKMPVPPMLGAQQLGKMIGEAIIDIPDDQWAEMVRISHMPCENPSCDCHTWQGRLFDALDDVRDSYKANRKGLNG